ncbi:MAG TPA: hypothetical protein VGA02_02835 [Gemmatimonadales bacterium]
MKAEYVTPQLVDYGSIAQRTLQTPGRAIKGGAPDCSHLDKFVELSGLSGCDT